MKKSLLILILVVISIVTQSKAQVYNAGFESLGQDGLCSNWGNVYIFSGGTTDSNGVFHPDSIVFDNFFYIPSPDAHSGNQAIELHNAFNYGTNTGIAGSVSNDIDSVFSGWSGFETVPVQTRPTELGFYYKYFPIGSDIGLARLWVYDAAMNQIGGVDIPILGTGNIYNYASAPVIYTTPGAVAAYYYLNFTTSAPGSDISFGTKLLIDDVSINGVTGINENHKKDAYQIYPNPVADKIIISGDIKSGTVPYIYNVSGGLTQHLPVVIIGGEIPVKELPAGTYILELRNGNQSEYHKFIKAR